MLTSAIQLILISEIYLSKNMQNNLDVIN